MAMIKRGDGSTGHIVEAVDGDAKGMCSGCGHLFQAADLADGKCGACEAGDAVVEASATEAPKTCCCGEKKTED